MISFNNQSSEAGKEKSLPPYQPKWIVRGFLFKYMADRRGGSNK